MASGDKENNPEKAIANITKGSDKKEDLMLIMNANSNWDRFFIPAPISISLLGELLLVSAERDISLRERCPEGGFTYLKYPDSLRACLVQISNSGWNAFNEAHTSMDQIRLHTSNVESHIKYAVRILFGGSVKEVEKLLPLSLNKVADIADTCMELASSTEQKFIYVMQLTEEALEACTAVKGHYEEKDKETEIAIRVAKEQKRLSEESKKQLEEHYEKMEKEMSQAKEDFDSALKEMPSSFAVLGGFMVQGFVDTMKNAASSVLALKSNAAFKLANVLSSGHKTELPVAVDKSVQNTNRVLSHIKAIQALFKDNKPNMNEIANGTAIEINQHLRKEKERLEGENPEIYDDVRQCIDDATTICSELIEYFKKGQHDKKKSRIILESYKTLTNKILLLEANIKKCSAYPMEPSRSAAKGANSPQTLTEALGENARFKTEMAKENLSNARRKHDQAYEEMRKESERLRKTLVELQSLDLSKIEFEEIQRTLCKGIRALAEVREQWGKLCEFFQMISNIIKCCLKSTLQNFVDYSREGRDLVLEGDKLSLIYKDTIIEQATEANRVAFVVQSISSAYVEISSNYLMDGILSLGKLIPLHPKENATEMVQKRAELHAMMEKAQNAISNIMEKNKREFDNKIEKRVNRIKTEVEAILPPISEVRIKEIQSTVQEAYKEDQPDIDIEQAIEDLF